MGASKPPRYVYKQVPALLKPPKRSIQRALPSALHIGITAAFSILVFAIINVAVSYSLGPRHKWAGIIQTATQVSLDAADASAPARFGSNYCPAVYASAWMLQYMPAFATDAINAPQTTRQSY
jgi:hypothetical protein